MNLISMIGPMTFNHSVDGEIYQGVLWKNYINDFIRFDDSPSSGLRSCLVVCLELGGR